MINLQTIGIMGLAIAAVSGASFFAGKQNQKAICERNQQQAIDAAEARVEDLERQAAEATEALTQRAEIDTSGIQSVDAQIEIEREIRAAESAQLKRDVANAISQLEIGDCGLEPMPAGVQFGLEQVRASLGDNRSPGGDRNAPDQSVSDDLAGADNTPG